MVRGKVDKEKMSKLIFSLLAFPLAIMQSMIAAPLGGHAKQSLKNLMFSLRTLCARVSASERARDESPTLITQSVIAHRPELPNEHWSVFVLFCLCGSVANLLYY